MLDKITQTRKAKPDDLIYLNILIKIAKLMDVICERIEDGETGGQKVKTSS